MRSDELLSVLSGNSHDLSCWGLLHAQPHQPKASARLNQALLEITEPPSAADLNDLGGNPRQQGHAMSIDPKPHRARGSAVLFEANLTQLPERCFAALAFASSRSQFDLSMNAWSCSARWQVL